MRGWTNDKKPPFFNNAKLYYDKSLTKRCIQMNYHPIESETWDILGGHLQIVNFEEKKLVDILEIPMWNTFPSKHTTTIFIFA